MTADERRLALVALRSFERELALLDALQRVLVMLAVDEKGNTSDDAQSRCIH